MARQVALGSDRGSRRPNPAQGTKRKEKGPAHTAGHIRAPREHQVFITGIPMKQLQEKNPHIGENTTNKATHTDLGLGLPPRHALGGVRATARGASPLPQGPDHLELGLAAWGLAGVGGALARSQGAAEGGRSPRQRPRPCTAAKLSQAESRPSPQPAGPPLQSAWGKLSLPVDRGLSGMRCDCARHALIISG